MHRRLAMYPGLALLAACATGAAVRGTETPHTGANTVDDEPTDARAPSCHGGRVRSAWLAPGFCVARVARGLDRPRQLAVGPDGTLYVATRRGIVTLWDENHDGRAGEHERSLSGVHDLANHGIAIAPDQSYLYASDDNAVRRWPFRPGLHAAEGSGEVAVAGLPTSETHPYKSIAFDRDGRLYVAEGSVRNVEAGAGAVIMRYALPGALPAGGVPFASGEVWARGLRNAEAMAFDAAGRLWALSNGRDFLQPDDAPSGFFLDHPGEGVFLTGPAAGAFYGYPSCWLLGDVPWDTRREPLSSWADHDPRIHETHDDAWCADPANVHPAAGVLPAHSAPLGAVVYTGSLLPQEYQGNLFVTLHGSWNRETEQTGRVVVRVVLEGDRVARIEPVFGQRAGDGNLAQGRWPIRPTGIAQGPDGALYVTSDDSGEVLRLGYER